jgi:DNA mismatch endonuclease (patch repair protein)
MADVLTQEQRRLNMSRIRGKNTNLELHVRKLLYAAGFRFRLHRRDLPGCPDIVLPKYNVCIFVHGCFWHGHKCRLFKLPSTRQEFWSHKITGNRERDSRSIQSLLELGWRVLTIWECALRGQQRMEQLAFVDSCISFLTAERQLDVITGVLP